MKKRIFTFVLCFVMVLSAVPFYAAAQTDYSSSIEMTLTTDCESMPKLDAGDTVELEFEIKNTGETIICCTDFIVTDKSGSETSDKAVMPFGLDWFCPGEIKTVSVTVTVTEEDISAGAVEREFTAVCQTWLSEETEQPIDENIECGFYPDGIDVSAGASAEIPVYLSSVHLSVSENEETAPCESCDEAEIFVQIKNTGNSVVFIDNLYIYNADGSMADGSVIFPDGFEWILPNETYTVPVTVYVTDDDAELQKVTRGIKVSARTWFDSETGAAADADSDKESSKTDGLFYSDILTVELPAVKDSFFKKIIKAIVRFFNKIAGFFRNLFN